MKAFIRVLVIGVIVLLIFVSWNYWEKPINFQEECIEFRLGSDDYNKINVSIKGVVRKSLLRKDTVRINMIIGNKDIPDFDEHKNVFPLNFSGKVAIDNKPVFKNVNYMEQDLIKFDNYYMIRISYQYYRGKILNEVFGVLYFDKKFSKMFITVDDKDNESGYSWTGKDGKVIVSELDIEGALQFISGLTEWNLN
ncbi:hypothetical protein SH1V18_33690 [Vallitalea longa]|uniref:Uncharacterized protein n=1 Tax=Vallitalea longa TaxID=2936439 RepID=A0A9W6DHI3_9FIRM|nr:hypothetical protein [Vallitalea longa]GKX30889.1 hypothetical protein SH1V18_33690 [Vallitalea longa]